MALTQAQIWLLANAKQSYDFPSWVWDGKYLQLKSIQSVEQFIHEKLFSKTLHDVRKGLASVVCWGWGNTALRLARTQLALDKTTNNQLQAFVNYRSSHPSGCISALTRLKLPQFNRMAFGTKVLAFMHPENRAVLDKKIVELLLRTKLVARFEGVSLEGALRVTRTSAEFYATWCECCRRGATQMQKGFRAVDIERAIFHLIRENQIGEAVGCVNALMQPLCEDK